MIGRLQKQIIIGLIFIFVSGSIFYSIFDRFFLIEATCFDGIQNGKEEGVDCGTLACGFSCQEPFKPLEISEEKLFQIGRGDYDFIARMFNPNTSYGASEITYSITFSGLGTRQGVTYILPGQTKYIVLTSLLFDEDSFVGGKEAVAADLKITSVKWEKLNIPSGEINLINRRGDFTNLISGGFFEGVVFNDSNYDFDKAEVLVILFSNETENNNKIVGVNKTEIRTLLSKTERSYRMSWLSEVPDVAKVDVQISTNLFENSNFIKNYGTQERFQEFY
ncbi:MAG: hypothetical protein COV30_00845 [Candidatus Yanofskybacteria bacterium CG10_big_fil_rev_8_21_14_0_10_37_15]|uniref:Uncharacterized protein n=1 Tax=Candidatus Yanofskybacteria bacterium CG10_big_fil_rev_8_21_14_0_10_37_15 TaxID=1975097 RepID=A0A2H0R628_9BACT|nr:MAG: hypothetical protein COV30_00845 [Candidatus Yanofskybacteria bacterium CG10_big_fil_rev_8_21_14_0_10_37_15]